jgi:hypothetical protein
LASSPLKKSHDTTLSSSDSSEDGEYSNGMFHSLEKVGYWAWGRPHEDPASQHGRRCGGMVAG